MKFIILMYKKFENRLQNSPKNFTPWETQLLAQQEETSVHIPTYRKEIVDRFLRTVKNSRKQNFVMINPKKMGQKLEKIPQSKEEQNQGRKISGIRKTKTEPIDINEKSRQDFFKEKMWAQYNTKNFKFQKISVCNLNQRLNKSLNYLDSMALMNIKQTKPKSPPKENKLTRKTNKKDKNKNNTNKKEPEPKQIHLLLSKTEQVTPQKHRVYSASKKIKFYQTLKSSLNKQKQQTSKRSTATSFF